MKRNIISLTLVALLSGVGSTAVFAHEDYSEGGSLHWIAHATETKSQPTANAQAPFGYAVNGSADRTVDIGPGTQYFNVTRLETIRINAGGKSVTWKFDTLGTSSFPLSNVIPGLDGITVYVAENPSYQGG
ncbi:MAG: CzcE family metal-binding protein [Rhodocyclaceae bacterium]|nr:CzcE family metal-binding protein [Rhodocyclaceae bacterium]MBX3670955.1 CzcE family metal-binding protein [Rhodocyclaceae bacterium]